MARDEKIGESLLTSASGLRIRFAVYLLVFAVYLLNRSPFVHFHDSAGFLSDALAGFSQATNATNHLLFNNFQHVLLLIFPFADPVLVLSLGVIVSSMITLILLEYWIREMTGNALYGIAGMSIMALSFTWWQQTEIIEVYAFNAMMFLLYVVPAFLDIRDGHRGRGILAAVFFGLSHLVHIQHILSWPFFVYYLLTGKSKAGTRWSMLLTAATIAGVLFLIQHFYPVNSISAIFFDSGFRDEVLGFQPVELIRGMIRTIAIIIYNFHIFLIFIPAGLMVLYKSRNRKIFYALAFLLLSFLGFGSKFNVPDNHVFFVPAWLALAVVMAHGMKKWKNLLEKIPVYFLAMVLVMSPLVYGSAWLTARQLPLFEEYQEEKEYKGGVAHIFWPGKAHAKDPLEMAKERLLNPALRDSLPEWNYCASAKCLILLGRWDGEMPRACKKQ